MIAAFYSLRENKLALWSKMCRRKAVWWKSFYHSFERRLENGRVSPTRRLKGGRFSTMIRR
ncbi:MAG TPA: hypothetical protein PK945_07305, partial [Bacillota bacterium]|nr:hypothetical protein [Bacillota bacterium]